MALTSTPRRAGPYAGTGTLTPYPFAFKVFSPTDVQVTVTDPQGLELDATFGTDYTVALHADQDAQPGGSVAMVRPVLAGYSVTLTSRVPYDQPMVLTNLGGFYPEVLNDNADRQGIQIQQLLEWLSRTLSMPVGSELTYEQLLDMLTEAQAWADQALAIAGTVPPAYDTAAALRAAGTPAGISYATTGGALAAGDGGGGAWRWDADSTADDDLGTVLLPAGHVGAGRWVRVISGAVSLSAWGLIGGGADDSAAVSAAFAALGSTVRELVIPDIGEPIIARRAVTIPDGVVVRGHGWGSHIKWDEHAVPERPQPLYDAACIYNRNYSRQRGTPDSFVIRDCTLEFTGNSTQNVRGLMLSNVDGQLCENVRFIGTESAGFPVTLYWAQGAWRNLAVRDCYFDHRSRGGEGGSLWFSNINDTSTNPDDVCRGLLIDNCEIVKEHQDEAWAVFSRQGLIENVIVRGVRTVAKGGVQQNVTSSVIAACDRDPAVWSAGQPVSVGDYRKPTSWNKRYYVCISAGVTGATEPAWDRRPFAEQDDGTARWLCYFCGVQNVVIEGCYYDTRDTAFEQLKISRAINIFGTADENYAGTEDVTIRDCQFYSAPDFLNAGVGPACINVVATESTTIRDCKFFGSNGSAGYPRRFIQGDTGLPIDLVEGCTFVGDAQNGFVRNVRNFRNNVIIYQGTDNKTPLEFVNRATLNRFRHDSAPFAPSLWLSDCDATDQNLFWSVAESRWKEQRLLFRDTGIRADLSAPDGYVNLLSHGRQIMTSAESNSRWNSTGLTITAHNASLLGHNECSTYACTTGVTATYSDPGYSVADKTVTLWFAARSGDGAGHLCRLRMGANPADRPADVWVFVQPRFGLFAISHTFGASGGSLYFEIEFPDGASVVATPIQAAAIDEIYAVCPTDRGAAGSGAVNKPSGVQWVEISAPPTWGAWLSGDVVHSATSTVGQPIGWRCTASGSPGTWAALAAL